MKMGVAIFGLYAFVQAQAIPSDGADVGQRSYFKPYCVYETPISMPKKVHPLFELVLYPWLDSNSMLHLYT